MGMLPFYSISPHVKCQISYHRIRIAILRHSGKRERQPPNRPAAVLQPPADVQPGGRPQAAGGLPEEAQRLHQALFGPQLPKPSAGGLSGGDMNWRRPADADLTTIYHLATLSRQDCIFRLREVGGLIFPFLPDNLHPLP